MTKSNSNKEIIKELQKEIEEYLYAPDAFDLDLRLSVTMDRIDEVLTRVREEKRDDDYERAFNAGFVEGVRNERKKSEEEQNLIQQGVSKLYLKYPELKTAIHSILHQEASLKHGGQE